PREPGVPILLRGHEGEAVARPEPVASEGTPPAGGGVDLAQPPEVEPGGRTHRATVEGVLRVDGRRVRDPPGWRDQRPAGCRPGQAVVADRTDTAADLVTAHQAA